MTLPLTILKRSNNMVSTYNDIFGTLNKPLVYSNIVVTTLRGMATESNTMVCKSNIKIITQIRLPAASSIMASRVTYVCIWSNKMLCWQNIVISAHSNMLLCIQYLMIFTHDVLYIWPNKLLNWPNKIFWPNKVLIEPITIFIVLSIMTNASNTMTLTSSVLCIWMNKLLNWPTIITSSYTNRSAVSKTVTLQPHYL